MFFLILKRRQANPCLHTRNRQASSLFNHYKTTTQYYMLIKIPQDTLWKGILEDLFAEFLLYFFPDWASTDVDFSKDFEFLDKELAEIIEGAGEGKRHADKLVKVYTKQGGTQWCLVHIEVQGYTDLNFATRMYDYFNRIRARYKENVLALAIYTDKEKEYQLNSYQYKFMGTELTYSFNTFKLAEQNVQSLDIPENPFSIIMLTAYQAIQKGMTKDKKQLEWKFALVRKYISKGYKTAKIRRILNFIRYYVSFENDTSQETYLQKLSTIINQPTHMGIEEAILAEVASQFEAKGEAQGEARGEARGEAQGEARAEARAEARDKEKTITVTKKLIARNFSDEDIMEVTGVDKDFIQQVRNQQT